MIEEVLLAEDLSPEIAIYPYLATPKIDGIRFYLAHGDVWTRSNKTIPNIPLRHRLPQLLPDGVDGEIFCGSFNATQSFSMAELRPLEESDVTLYLFDYCPGSTSIPYMDRIKSLNELIRSLGWHRSGLPGTIRIYSHPSHPFKICPLLPVWIQDFKQLETYYSSCLNLGYEGIMLRSPTGEYKYGRSTHKENLLLKYKPTIDREAIILGVEEQLRNTNPSYTNELGRSKRSVSRDGLVPAGLLGSFHVRDIQTEVDFHVGSGPGLTWHLRQDLWSRRTTLPGKVIEYRSMAYGVKDRPRQPQFLCIKEERSM